ncbi:alpha/beta hydrolase [uncultured Imperialibacter sp.]|uniref:alpha/beta hydrolase n=1 Tax=uncultured Imperialibacter sp. TaxID=1672639 RepID=UPI0030D9D65D|tara:strand:+ start:48763 stop:49689 length:927 start_codon:yes stop_codon:yes gene_type:complete
MKKVLIQTSGEEKKIEKPAKKTNAQMEWLIKGLLTLQHVSPKLTSSIIWNQFTKTPRVRFNDKQNALIEKAEISVIKYRGNDLKAYRWLPADASNGKTILLSHGWGSKIADFRRMIETLVAEGYSVEGVDMKGHGLSAGTHTALPEIRDVLKTHYSRNGPYHAVVGYSIGGLAAGLTVNEMSTAFHPNHLIIIATPPYTRYFFQEIIDQVGCKERVFTEMCELVEKHYHESIDYFDLRNKADNLQHLDLHMIYDEHDKTVPFTKGLELNEMLPMSSFVHVTGTSHNQIIADEKVIGYILDAVAVKAEV